MAAYSLLVAEVGVLARTMVLAAVFYYVWGTFSGAGTTWAGYAKIVLVLFVLANVVFYGARRLRPDLVDTASAVEEHANDQFR